MEFIATYWYIWLVVMLVGYGYALANQYRRMKGMMTAPMSSFDSVGGSFFKGMGLMFVAAAIGAGGMVMLVIAIIVNIIRSAG